MAFNIGDLPILLSELTCSKCDKVLSVLPIYSFSNIGGNVCGRCAKTALPQSVDMIIQRNTAYESLAKHVLLFPCSNRKFGCATSLKYDEVVGHEKGCIYRQAKCPFYVKERKPYSCGFLEGTIIELSDHLNSSHQSSNKTHQSHCLLIPTTPFFQVNYVEVESYTFVVIARLTAVANQLHFLVMCCAEEAVCKSYTYQIKLTALAEFESLDNLSKVDNTSVLLDTDEALDMVEHIAFDVKDVLTFFGNINANNLYYRLSITKKPNEIAESTSMPKEPSNSETSSDAEPSMPHSNKLILEELECPVCKNYMRPPIYICTKGHSLCNKCKIKVKGCPICRVSSVNSRNFTLENLTQKVLYPCRYSRKGCTEVLSGCVIAQHETTCNFKSNCPLFMLTGVLCDDVGETTQNLIDHIHETHSDILTKRYLILCTKDVKSSVCTYRVLITDEEIFIWCYKNSSSTGSIKFNFFHLGMKENVPRYRYILEFIDQTQLGSKLIVQQVYQPLPAIFTDAFQNCLNVPLDLLGHYITNDMVNFKVNIEKI